MSCSNDPFIGMPNCRHTLISPIDTLEKQLQQLSVLTKNLIAMQSFEIKVTIPINTGDIYKCDHRCGQSEIGIVSVERATIIRDAINRQLNGLKATAPKEKKATPVKKTAKKK